MSTQAPSSLSPWPYPRWIAHRGAGQRAPENTLAAFRLGAQLGYRMFECDAKLSADGVAMLMHDATLERTTNGKGLASAQSWGVLSQLDAGAWHSNFYAGEPPCTLIALMQFCIEQELDLNIEIKPTPGADALTARTIGWLVLQCWPGGERSWPFLTSFSTQALKALRVVAPQLPCGLLVDEIHSDADWIEPAIALGCQALVLNAALWTPQRLAVARRAGLHALCYTVNDAQQAQQLLDMGLDAIITDTLLPQGNDASGG
ncbi:MAG: glycerophosphodiester phosphodiesterase [Brachymonas sp.]|nr:glycerophosphodiester phosphodiesterase [Brachymonas sp.]